MTILAYHSIDATWDDPLAVSPEDFARQMEVVARMRPLAIADYVRLLRAGRLPKRAVAVTFDDGYANNLERAAPVCRDLGIKPAVFLAADHVSSGAALGWRPEGRDSNRPLDWEGVRRLAAEGWTVGSHTSRHSDLVAVDSGTLTAELSDSRLLIEKEVGLPVDLLSYPYGRHDERVRRAAAEAGYDAAFSLPTGREHHDSLMAIPRVGVFGSDGPATFRLKLLGLTLAMKLRLRRARPVEGSAEWPSA